MAEIQMVRVERQSAAPGSTGKTGQNAPVLDFSEMLREKGQNPKPATGAASADRGQIRDPADGTVKKEETQEPASSLEPTEEGLSAAMEILVQNMMQSPPESGVQEPVVTEESLAAVEPAAVETTGPVEMVSAEPAEPVIQNVEPAAPPVQNVEPAVLTEPAALTAPVTQEAVVQEPAVQETAAAPVEQTHVERRQETPRQSQEKVRGTEETKAPAADDIRSAQQTVQKENGAVQENAGETRQDVREEHTNESRTGRTEQTGRDGEEVRMGQMLQEQTGGAMMVTDANGMEAAGSIDPDGEIPVVKTAPETLPRDVGEAIVSRLPLKNGALTLELEPASLGKITVRMVFEDGKAVVSLFSANARTLEILSHRAGEMAQILEEKTGEKTVVYVPEQQHFAQDERGGQEQGSRQQREGRAYEEREHHNGQQTESFMHQLRLGLA